MMTGTPRSRGEIITFYSYKGGTGRTMALANVACLLAERVADDEGVLVVDWDLEAPGLHRFFPGRLAQPSSTDLGLDGSPGLIDLFVALELELPSHPAKSEDAADTAIADAFARIPIERYVGESGIPHVRILRSGRNDDGQYSTRVNTFNWEGLFRRAPTVYRQFAERLAQRFRYVLIDSRTGVTDISGICTSLLPEKLVVVFTPNRQSLTGVRELVDRATSYRRSSDDLRPLLVYPLPSRIEASLQDLRAHWRFGNRDLNITGYQPMFEAVFAEAYDQRCDMKAYFDEVQIQQTPDYAYGEEIAVRRSGDRFSLGNSYRVFVDRLVSGEPPWSAAPDRGTKPVTVPSPPRDDSTGVVVVPPGAGAPHATPAPPEPTPQRAGDSPKIFLSYAREDRDRVEPIARAFEAQGWDVHFDVTMSASNFDNAIERALDGADAIVVCWSKVSTVSRWVQAEAYEGVRRGILVPVLLDDVVPPLGFRSVQAADFSRGDTRSLARLVQAVGAIAKGRPGDASLVDEGTGGVSTLVRTGPASEPKSNTWLVGLVAAAAIAVLVLVVAVGWWISSGRVEVLPPNPGDTPPVTTPLVTLPNFVGSQTADVTKTADLLKLMLGMRDEHGQESSFFDGVVTAQSPAAGTSVPQGSRIELNVSTLTVAVPTLVRETLDAALQRLEDAQLQLGKTESRSVPDVKAGTIISQTPEAGVKVAAGTAVDVVVAAGPRPPAQRRTPTPSYPEPKKK